MTLRWSVKNEYGGVMTDSCSKGVRGREVSLGDLRLAASATRRPFGDLVGLVDGNSRRCGRGFSEAAPPTLPSVAASASGSRKPKCVCRRRERGAGCRCWSRPGLLAPFDRMRITGDERFLVAINRMTASRGAERALMAYCRFCHEFGNAT
jgi:hypothetical protein